MAHASDHRTLLLQNLKDAGCDEELSYEYENAENCNGSLVLGRWCRRWRSGVWKPSV